jgi:hypothetical protein
VSSGNLLLPKDRDKDNKTEREREREREREKQSILLGHLLGADNPLCYLGMSNLLITFPRW